MNEFFANIVPNLNIAQYEPVDSFSSNITDPVLKAVEKYKNHPSIVAIKTRRENINFSFSFQKIERSEILQIISELDPKKAIQSNDIPTKMIKENCEIFADFLLSSLNKCLSEGGFPSFLKEADVIPIFKKGLRTSKENYRPISILKNISKIFERPIFKQIDQYFKDILSPYQCGFRKGFSAKHCVLAMLEKKEKCNDENKIIGALLTDLSKAFDCLPHDLLIAKLNAYGFDEVAIKVIYNYLY